MPTTVNNSQNTVTITDNNANLEITDNNTGNIVNVTGVDISTVTISDVGPKGDKGDPGEYVSGSSPEFHSINASGNISSSGGTITAGQFVVEGKLSHANDANTELAFSKDTITLKANNQQQGRFGSNNLQLGNPANPSPVFITASTIDVVGTVSSLNLTTLNLGSGGITLANQESPGDSDSFSVVQTIETDESSLGAANYNMSITGDITMGGNLNLSGSHNRGHITASGNISASGDIFANKLNVGIGTFDTLDVDGNIALGNGSIIYSQFTNRGRIDLYGNSTNESLQVQLTGGDTELSLRRNSGIEIVGNVTASGNIKSGGNLELTASATGHITASGNISASGTGQFGDDITITSGSLNIETFNEGIRFFNGTNYTANKITLSTAQNLQISVGGVIQLYDQTQMLAASPIRFNNADNTDSIFVHNGGGTGVNKSRLDFEDSSNNVKMSISSSGNVGIGTTEPSSELHIKTNSPTPSLLLETAGASANFMRFTTTDGTFSVGQDYDDNFSISNRSNITSGRVFTMLQSNGNIGIGETSPSAPLHISTSATDPGLLVDGGIAGNAVAKFRRSEGISPSSECFLNINFSDSDSQLRFEPTTETNRWSIGASNDDGKFEFAPFTKIKDAAVIHFNRDGGIYSTAITASGNISASGDIFAGDTNASGVVLRSPDGSKFRLQVDNSGNLSTTSV